MIEELTFSDVLFSFDEEALPDLPAMADGVSECCRKGMFISNVRKLTLHAVSVEGQEGPPYIIQGEGNYEIL